ncbi:HupE/UreJ family protein [Cohnella endophytica]|uniref:HupE/UreJ family protein n=1 Tax=Cohnella endophytica TaxID=2419778 RepID=A0A494X9G0_9BACL|nr:HupE/UreJ family protein [Cohnella endophytica]RKP46291.1 HupE/UreJ family protein [Cohnella endophytica]
MFRIHSAIRSTICVLSVLALLLIPLTKADAHAYSASYTTLNLTKTSSEMTFSLDELSVIELTKGDLNNNGILDPDEFVGVKEQLIELLQNNLQFTLNNENQTWTTLESFTLDGEGKAAKVTLKVFYPPVSDSKTVGFIDHLYSNAKDGSTNYVNLVTITYGKKSTSSALSGKYRSWSMQITESDYSSLLQDGQPGTTEGTATDESSASESISGWYSFFKLGMDHILTGYDHLLFLFSLLIARQKFKQYASMITAFTIAHSITLSLTVLGIINVPSYIVEPAIALSICYVAIDNIVRKQVSYRWVLTFLFGLIHGMGFADILQEMNIPKNQLAVNLISFNIGIETVQVILVAILLPLLVLLHRWRFSRNAVLGGSTLALILGGIWLVERVTSNL